MRDVEPKELAAKLRALIERMIENGGFRVPDLEPLDEAARRIEFGYIPSAEPPPKSAIELQREKEIHEHKQAQMTRARSAGLGGHGMAAFNQESGHLHLFASMTQLQEFSKKVNSTMLGYNKVLFHDRAGVEITLVDIDVPASETGPKI